MSAAPCLAFVCDLHEQRDTGRVLRFTTEPSKEWIPKWGPRTWGQVSLCSLPAQAADTFTIGKRYRVTIEEL